MPDGWIRTRDMARRDQRGYLYWVDRRSDMIVTGPAQPWTPQLRGLLS